jgi:hypothetical protein
MDCNNRLSDSLAKKIEYVEGKPAKTNFDRFCESAFEFAGYVPLAGTVVGTIRWYKASKEPKSDWDAAKFWKTAKIIMNLASFLLVPQIVYGILCVADACKNKWQEYKAAKAELNNGLRDAIDGFEKLNEDFKNIRQTQDNMVNEAKDLFGDAAKVLFQ